jgi:mono/diheme cytochrome c family protein
MPGSPHEKVQHVHLTNGEDQVGTAKPAARILEGSLMTQNKIEQHVLLASTALLLLFVVLTLFVASIARANPVPDAAASRATFKEKCAMCHGEDGAGSDVGKSLHAPDLRSAAVQKLSNSELTQVITNGKGGMPAFKDSLSEDQIHGLVAHVRSLRAKK